MIQAGWRHTDNPVKRTNRVGCTDNPVKQTKRFGMHRQYCQTKKTGKDAQNILSNAQKWWGHTDTILSNEQKGWGCTNKNSIFSDTLNTCEK